MFKKKCEYCGKEYEVYNYRKNKSKFCSFDCLHKSRKGTSWCNGLNDIIIGKYFSEILITSKKYGYIKVKIDTEDVEKVKMFHWHLRKIKFKNFEDVLYVENGQKQQLHRMITNCPKGLQVDHINHDTLDNRKQNLRCVTAKENLLNRRKYK